MPINTAYKGEYLRHQLADSGAKVLVIDGDVADRARAIADSDRHPRARRRARRAGGRAATTTPGTNWHSWGEVMSADDTPNTPAMSPTDLYVFIYTGGTTGLSKGCVINNNYCVTLAKQIATMWERGPDDVVWTPLPLFHFNAVSVVLVGTLLTGGRAAIYKKFSVSNFWPEINRTGATHASTLGSMVTLIANDPMRPEAPDSGHARGEHDAAVHVGRADAAGRRARSASSASGSGRSTPGTAPPRGRCGAGCRPGMENKPNAAGIVNDEYWDIRIFDDDDNEVPVETPGRDRRSAAQAERDVRRLLGPARGHRRDVPQPLDAQRRHRRASTPTASSTSWTARPTTCADAARTSRATSSKRCSSAIPTVADVAVFAVPSPVTEDDIMVAVEIAEGSTVTEEELYRWSLDAIPYFALPRYIEIRDELPRSDMKKILKAPAPRGGRRSEHLGRRQERHRGREALTEQPAFESTTLGELFGEVADAFPDAVAYVEGDERVTFGEWVRAGRLARGDAGRARRRAR